MFIVSQVLQHASLFLLNHHELKQGPRPLIFLDFKFIIEATLLLQNELVYQTQLMLTDFLTQEFIYLWRQLIFSLIRLQSDIILLLAYVFEYLVSFSHRGPIVHCATVSFLNLAQPFVF
jgi:hypothetical protein